MENNPKVSICIPTYKQLEFLKRTLDSILQQTYKDYEVIVSDDTADDSVFNLLKKYNFGSQLKYYKNPVSLGSPKNWNEAIRHASGEYIKILHHDDWFSFNNSLEEYVKMLDENPESDFAFSGTIVYHADTNESRVYCIKETILSKVIQDPLVIFFGNYIGGPSATIYRKKANKFYDTEMKWIVDVDFYISVLRENPKLVFNKNPLITTTTAASHSITTEVINSKEVNIFEQLHLYQKIKNRIDPKNKKIYLNYLWDLFKRYNVQTVKEIQQLGIHEIPPELKRLLFLKKFPSLFLKIYQKNIFPKKEIQNHPYFNL